MTLQEIKAALDAVNAEYERKQTRTAAITQTQRAKGLIDSL